MITDNKVYDSNLFIARRKLSEMKKQGRLYQYHVREDKDPPIRVQFRPGHPICKYTIKRFISQLEKGSIDRLGSCFGPPLTPERLALSELVYGIWEREHPPKERIDE